MSTELFVKLPLWVMDLGLTPKQLEFYAQVARFRFVTRGHRHNGMGFPTRQELEEATGLSRSRVNTLLCELKKKGAFTSVQEEGRVVIDFVRPEDRPGIQAEERGNQAGERGNQAGTPTPKKDDQRRSESASANAPASQKPRAKKQQPPSADEIKKQLREDGTFQQWQQEFPALDGRNGRPSLAETICDAMEWQHERKARWKTNQKRFLKRWVRTTAARFWGAYRYDLRADGGGRPAHVIEDNPVRPGVNFNEVEDV